MIVAGILEIGYIGNNRIKKSYIIWGNRYPILDALISFFENLFYLLPRINQKNNVFGFLEMKCGRKVINPILNLKNEI